MKKALPYILFILLAAAVLVGKVFRFSNKSSGDRKENSNDSQTHDNKFNRSVSYLEYTHHARCRMDCRHITPEEVQDILHNGEINYKKSNKNASPCPIYSLEGFTTANEKLRIVFAQCDDKTKVVTVIDLDKDWQCNCPGDENKNKNQN